MRDKLLFTTIGLLVGIVVMQWTMPASNASYVTPVTGIVAAETGIWANPVLEMMDQNGVKWRCQVGNGPNGGDLLWYQETNQAPLPVPVSSIKFWNNAWLVTQDNHVWMTHDVDGPWTDFGPWPGAPVATQQSTWGKVKAAFNGKGDKR